MTKMYLNLDTTAFFFDSLNISKEPSQVDDPGVGYLGIYTLLTKDGTRVHTPTEVTELLNMMLRIILVCELRRAHLFFHWC